MYEVEDSWAGFEWLAADDADRNIVSFIRRDKNGGEVIVLASFSGADATDYLLGVNKRGKYRIVFSSDDTKFGGEGKLNKKVLTAVKRPSHGKEYSVPIDVPKLCCLYLVREDTPSRTKSGKKAQTDKGITA